MIPKEKAYLLVNKIRNIENDNTFISISLSKKLALIAVDEIIEANPIKFDEYENCIAKQWWQEVKTEIEKL